MIFVAAHESRLNPGFFEGILPALPLLPLRGERDGVRGVCHTADCGDLYALLRFGIWPTGNNGRMRSFCLIP